MHCESFLPRVTKTIAVATPANAVPASAPTPPNMFVGTSGWAYPTWKPGFYPADVPPRAFLHFYAACLTSVEVNYTFRTLPTPAQLQGWLEATPPNFRFSFKAPQRITHFQRLRESNATLAEFLELPSFAANPHLQLAFEFRHPSWFTDATYDILRRHNAALCVAESDDLVTPDVATANFRCYRLRRNGGYSSTELTTFVRRFTKLALDTELYIYFKHEDEPTGALNATAFLAAASIFTTAKSTSPSKAAGRK